MPPFKKWTMRCFGSLRKVFRRKETLLSLISKLRGEPQTSLNRGMSGAQMKPSAVSISSLGSPFLSNKPFPVLAKLPASISWLTAQWIRNSDRKMTYLSQFPSEIDSRVNCKWPQILCSSFHQEVEFIAPYIAGSCTCVDQWNVVKVTVSEFKPKSQSAFQSLLWISLSAAPTATSLE